MIRGLKVLPLCFETVNLIASELFCKQYSVVYAQPQEINIEMNKITMSDITQQAQYMRARVRLKFVTLKTCRYCATFFLTINI